MRVAICLACFFILAFFAPNPGAYAREGQQDASAQSGSADQQAARGQQDGAPKGKTEGKPQGPPPAKVVLARAETGMVRPQTEFVGTVYFPEESTVASEVSGVVRLAPAEEGRDVNKGEVLARLSTDLLRQQKVAAVANHERVLAQLEDARTDLRRIRELFQAQSVSQSELDQARYEVESLKKQSHALKSDVALLQLKINKTVIRAPFSGVVLEKHANLGEWLSPGGRVATIARNDFVDVIVDAPQEILPYIEPGMNATVRAAGRELNGEIFAVIPRGDVAHRTFPIKTRVRNHQGLAQGMEARVMLPTGEKTKAVFVPRDAVIQQMGRFVVWTMKDGVARQIPVTVAAYQGMQAAVQARELKEGCQVVIKGNERLRPGQPLFPANGSKPGPGRREAGQDA